MYEDQVEKVKRLKEDFSKSLASLDLDHQKKLLEEQEKNQQNPELFKNLDQMKKTNKEAKRLMRLIEPWKKIDRELADLETLVAIAQEESDESFSSEIEQHLEDLSNRYRQAEILRLFYEEDDDANAYLTIHAGAGGTESCDWAAMLHRMYTRYAERKGFKVSLIDFQSGEEAGIRSATMFVVGDYSTGHLRSEVGVHRLVRISPFDSNKRRHTSFASVTVTPEIDDSTSVEIIPSDLRIDTFRASGAGGQHVNTTDSAVRITHMPTGIVVSCQAERSQLQNKDKAFKVLKAKLYEHEREKKMSKQRESDKLKKKIEWGSQVRSYIFHPYTMVKDHRTDEEISDVSAVMDGEIDRFVESFLYFRYKHRDQDNVVNSAQ